MISLRRMSWALAAFALAVPCQAVRHALLIGVSTYSDFPAFQLEGPREDVPALRRALVDHWTFPERNILTLVDAQATKANILAALDRLIRDTEPGDQVFIYFSGHGTSALDPKSRIGLPLNSGALIPADVHKSAPSEMLRQLIIGATDLKPRLRQLDQNASVFVVIDSCYSGAAVKSLAGGLLTSREMPLPALSSRGPLTPPDYDAAYESVQLPPSPPDDYPYQHLIFLAAAAQSEKAWEANVRALSAGVLQTVDGRPHGLLTDSLLRALRGEADENHDGNITYEELRRFAYTRVMHLGQTPQLLPRNEPGLTAQPLFGSPSPSELAPPPIASPAGEVTLRLSPGAASLAPRFKDLKDVRLVTGEAAALAIARTGDHYDLFIGNGVQIRSYSESDLEALVSRVRREPAIRRLKDLTFPRQAFHAVLDVDPADRDAYALHEMLHFRISADRPAWLLLLNIDITGEVSVMYRTPAAQPELAGQPRNIRSCVESPVGTEYMKLFAFPSPPTGWDDFSAGDFSQLARLLEGAPPTSAQTTWLTYTTDRRPASAPLCETR